jgi:hypothetical protein
MNRSTSILKKSGIPVYAISQVAKRSATVTEI